MNRLLACAAGLLLSALSLSAVHAQPLEVTDAWVRQGPPTAQVLAAYMKLKNPGAQTIVLSGASSPQFERIEMHRTEVVDGIARMLPQEHLKIPPGGEAVLQPGGLHLMLINAKQPLTEGAKVRIDLHLDAATRMAIEVPVRPDAKMTNGKEDNMDHSQHQHQH